MSGKSSNNKSDDRRARRTRRSLSDALIELILEKRYDSITIQDVIDRADVGRSTFYAHYRDKEDLFLSGWERLLDGFVERINWGNAGESRFVPVQELFSHVQDFHRFYKALMKSRKTDLIFKTGLEYLSKGIESSMASMLTDKPQPSVPVAVLSNYLAGEVFGFLKWWLDHGMPYTAERMDKMFHQLVVPGLLSGLNSIEADTGEKETSRPAAQHSHAFHSHKQRS